MKEAFFAKKTLRRRLGLGHRVLEGSAAEASSILADGKNEKVRIIERETLEELTASATADASPASSTPCTASPPTRRATSTRPRPTRASACRSSSTRASARCRAGTRACPGRSDSFSLCADAGLAGDVVPFLDPRYVSSGFTSGRGPFCQTGQPPLGAPSMNCALKNSPMATMARRDSDHCRDSRNILLLTSGDRPRWRVARRPRRRDDPESGLRGATQMRELLFCIHTAGCAPRARANLSAAPAGMQWPG